MKASLSIGKYAGIQVTIHWTFLILLGWIVFLNMKAGSQMITIFWSVGFVVAIFVCVVLHEFGHALMAQRFHIHTKDITLYPIGGIARLESIPKKPKEELLVAIAGPAVNIVIAGVLYPFINSSMQESLSLTDISADNFLPAFVGVNFSLAVFNLIPAFPMDGGRVFRALLAFKMSRVRATKVAAVLGQTIALGFMIIGFYVNPFLIIIGLFIFMGAKSEANVAQTEALLEGQSIGSITMRQFASLPVSTTIGEAVNIMLNSEKKNFAIVDDAEIVGTLGQSEIIKGLNEYDENVLVTEIMRKDILYLPITLSMEEALIQLQRENKSIAVVMNQAERVGLIDTENLIEFILFQSARMQHREQIESNR